MYLDDFSSDFPSRHLKINDLSQEIFLRIFGKRTIHKISLTHIFFLLMLDNKKNFRETSLRQEPGIFASRDFDNLLYVFVDIDGY